MISSPGLVTARIAWDSAPAAPVVGKMWLPVYAMPKRSLRFSAIASLTDGIPSEGE